MKDVIYLLVQLLTTFAKLLRPGGRRTGGGRKSGPKGPSKEVTNAIVEMKQHNPGFGCPRIARQINLAFGLDLDKDVVRRILATHYRPDPSNSGPYISTYRRAK
jgi:hypothetical protein